MGRWVSSYRGHLLAFHGGDLPGFHSQVSIMPNDGIGVIVLVVGDHVAPFYNGLTYHIYERLLGLPLTPWSERLNGIRLKNKAAGTKARAAAAVGKVAGTTPSHPLDDYVGEFEHPAYGVVTVARGDKGLAFEFHGIKMPLGHFHYDRFDTPDDEEDGKFSLNFRTSPMGEVDSAEISLDEAAVTFTRRVPAALTADATLQQYAGTYQSPSGGKVEVAFQPGKGLSIRGAGGVDLQPWRPHQFRVKEFPDVVVSFTVEGGKVRRDAAAGPERGVRLSSGAVNAPRVSVSLETVSSPAYAAEAGLENGPQHSLAIISYIVSFKPKYEQKVISYVNIDVVISFHYEYGSWRAGPRGS